MQISEYAAKTDPLATEIAICMDVTNQNDGISRPATDKTNAGACQDLAPKTTARLANPSFDSGFPALLNPTDQHRLGLSKKIATGRIRIHLHAEGLSQLPILTFLV